VTASVMTVSPLETVVRERGTRNSQQRLQAAVAMGVSGRISAHPLLSNGQTVLIELPLIGGVL
jgi:hypothetical protein